MFSSYFRHTYIRPFCDEILTAIFVLFCTWLLIIYDYLSSDLKTMELRRMKGSIMAQWTNLLQTTWGMRWWWHDDDDAMAWWHYVDGDDGGHKMMGIWCLEMLVYPVRNLGLELLQTGIWWTNQLSRNRIIRTFWLLSCQGSCRLLRKLMVPLSLGPFPLCNLLSRYVCCLYFIKRCFNNYVMDGKRLCYA